MSAPIIPLTPAQTVFEESQAAHDNLIIRILVPLDQFVNAETGGREDETISTRLAMDAYDGHGISKEIGVVGSRALDWFQPDHGADAAAGDLERAQAEAAAVKASGIVKEPR